MQSQDLVRLFRANGFNCFPISPGKKIADYRYNGSHTAPDQIINPNDNYGYIPIEGMGTCIIDFDDKKFKDKLNEFAEKFLVIISPHGFHLPVKGISGNVSKIELFDYDFSSKKIIEIQGPNHYCVGPGSKIDIDPKTGETNLEYVQVGTNQIMDVRGEDFHELIAMTCKTFNVVGRKKSSGSYAHIREKVKNREVPSKGQSNDYFNQAAMVLNTEGKTREEAMNIIQSLYHKWEKTEQFSDRPWNNIEMKVNEAYDNDLKIFHGGHKKKEGPDVDDIVQQILSEKKLYSDKEQETIYQEMNGFVSIVTTKIKYDIIRQFNSDRVTTGEIMPKIIANCDDLPEVDEDIIIFKNGYYRISTHSFHEHDESHGLGVMGFEDYDYKESPNCTMFERFMKDTFPDDTMREYALVALSCCVIPEHQERITMCYGPAGTGKTTYREILLYVLGDYAKSIDNNAIFSDMFGLADWENKTYISLGESPKSIKEFDKLKRITGDSTLVIRKMHQAQSTVPNYTKIIMDANNLFKIPDDEGGPMFDRLHLLEFTQRFRYTVKDIKRLSKKIAESEGEDIVSMLLNTYSPENKYPSPRETKSRWEDISIPEKGIFSKLFEYVKSEEGMSQMDIKLYMEEHSDIQEVDMNIIRKLCKDMGYSLSNGIYKGLTAKKLESNNLENY